MSRLREEPKTEMSRLREEPKTEMSRLREEPKTVRRENAHDHDLPTAVRA